MIGSPALQAAIDLVQVPTRMRHVRSQPLPEGLSILLRLAAGDEDALQKAAMQCGRSSCWLRGAAEFFIEQILFSPGADSYRVLGADPRATTAELRRNMILLLKWLHPDSGVDQARSVFASRVIRAWEDLKTPGRRAAYDRSCGS